MGVWSGLSGTGGVFVSNVETCVRTWGRPAADVPRRPNSIGLARPVRNRWAHAPSAGPLMGCFLRISGEVSLSPADLPTHFFLQAEAGGGLRITEQGFVAPYK